MATRLQCFSYWILFTMGFFWKTLNEMNFKIGICSASFDFLHLCASTRITRLVNCFFPICSQFEQVPTFWPKIECTVIGSNLGLFAPQWHAPQCATAALKSVCFLDIKRMKYHYVSYFSNEHEFTEFLYTYLQKFLQYRGALKNSFVESFCSLVFTWGKCCEARLHLLLNF